MFYVSDKTLILCYSWCFCLVFPLLLLLFIYDYSVYIIMDYLRMDGKQYASKVQNKALEDFDWLSQWLE